MATRKVTITIDEALFNQLSDVAESTGAPVSRIISEAAAHEMRMHAGRVLLTQWQAEHGAFTYQEIASARAELAAAESSALTAATALADRATADNAQVA